MSDNDRPYETVVGWLEEARKFQHAIPINLYFSPFAEAFNKLAPEQKLHGVPVGIYLYKAHLYRIGYGPGDCEQHLTCLGPVESFPIKQGVSHDQ
jgi:hypothetical protein